MGVVVDPIQRDADEVVELLDAFAGLEVVELLMGLNRLDDLVSDRVNRIQRVHRTLEDDGDLLPPDRVELRMVSPQASILETRDPEEVALLARRLEAGRRLAEDASHLRIARGDP